MPPNWKYPCIVCANPVKTNQRGLECNTCLKWVHLRCTDLNEDQYKFLEENINAPFYCQLCKPIPHPSDPVFDNTTVSTSNENILNDSTTSTEFSSAHSSDYEYIDDSDSDSRGLNFDSLPSKKMPTQILKIRKEFILLHNMFLIILKIINTHV